MNKTIKTPQDMFEEKQRSINNAMDRKELGAQIGACLNKAVDIVIAEGKFERQEIEKWVDILFEIGTAKKVAEMLEKIPQEEIINEEEPNF